MWLMDNFVGTPQIRNQLFQDKLEKTLGTLFSMC